ncbi:MAG: hypothetical protein MK066_02270 [Crocinitomicaceae bacterium]|nr:hypothetical protein [Crocinitomicaceae bacterium]
MKQLVLCFLILISFVGRSQQNLIPIHSFYKDQLFANKLEQPYNNGSFFPTIESDYNLIPAIIDSTKRYYTFSHILYQKHLLEMRGKDAYLTISPAANINYGRDLGDTSLNRVFQNTRGILVEGDFFKNFSFSTSFYENQAEVTRYERNYYNSNGERYIASDSSYQVRNAVIPGAGRTKPFKIAGYDYAFATGYFVYEPTEKLHIIAGNNTQFIGDGHRSLLLSDNSFNAPYIRLNWKISDQFSMVYMRSRHLNLLRRPEGSTAENYYESKGYSVNYFTYTPTEKSAISLFEGSVWNRGDSIVSKHSHSMYYSPIPIISPLIAKDEVVSLIGINASYQLAQHHRLYGQVAINNLEFDKTGYQLGYRGYNFFGLTDFMVQLEYNQTSSRMYEVSNPRLNYSHYNLPLAHIKGSGVQEFILRTNYEYEHWYVNLNVLLIREIEYSPEAHLPLYANVNRKNGIVFYENMEIGYRFNRKMNLSIFTNWTYRHSDSDLTTNVLNFGFKTALANHYKDF